MIVQENSFAFPMFNDVSYKSYTYNQLMLSNDICFNISDFVFKDVSNNLHFDEFILNYQAISHRFSFDKNRDMSNVKKLYKDNNSDEFFIERIPKQQQNILQALLSIEYIPSTELSIGINNNRKNENTRSHSPNQISKSMTAAVNILFTLLSENDADLN